MTLPPPSPGPGAQRKQVLVFRALPPDQLARLQAVHDVTVADPRKPEERPRFDTALAQAQGLIGASFPIDAALLARATQHRTPSGDGQVIWHRWGTRRPGALPVVMLHGGSGSWTHWIRNIDALVAAGHELWLPDLPGFGDSAPPPVGFDADAMVEPLYQGMQQLGLLPCQLVGFSFGGMTAGMLAAAHPDAAERLVIVGAPAMGVVPEKQFSLKGWRHLPDAAQQRDDFPP